MTIVYALQIYLNHFIHVDVECMLIKWRAEAKSQDECESALSFPGLPSTTTSLSLHLWFRLLFGTWSDQTGGLPWNQSFKDSKVAHHWRADLLLLVALIQEYGREIDIWALGANSSENGHVHNWHSWHRNLTQLLHAAPSSCLMTQLYLSFQLRFVLCRWSLTSSSVGPCLSFTMSFINCAPSAAMSRQLCALGHGPIRCFLNSS